MSQELQIVAPGSLDIVLDSGVETLMRKIRPEWKNRRLIERVRSLLATDPSSACQRILNAAIHDLRQKIVVAGLDIAQEVATRFRLPSVSKVEDILDTYSVSHIIDIAYRMGLLRRPEWRRLCRCYEIRRDLEHEDDEYEATAEDCVYIFKTCVEVVLSQDPVELIKVSDVQTAISSPGRLVPSAELIENFKHAPDSRQLLIVELLVNTALDSKKADIIRQNAMEFLTTYKPVTATSVQIAMGEELQKRIGKKPLDMTTARVSYAAGVLPYLKQRQLHEFFAAVLKRFETVSYHWTKHSEHTKLFDDFEDIGAFRHCPDALKEGFLLWMALCYVGEQGGYGMGVNRPVFYSNAGAPRVEAIFKRHGSELLPYFELVMKDKMYRAALQTKHITRRAEQLLEYLIEKEPLKVA